MDIEMMWPECFDAGVTQAEKYRSDEDAETRVSLALADQLTGWGICMAGSKPPEIFGRVMAMLSSITGAGTPDQCMALSKQRHP